MARSFIPFLFLLAMPQILWALPGGWGGVIVAGVRDPLETSAADSGNLVTETSFSLYRQFELSEKVSFRITGRIAGNREEARRSFNLTNSVSLGGAMRYTSGCCGVFSAGIQYAWEEEVSTGATETGLKAGFDHGIYKKIAGEWTSPRVFSGWSNIRFPGALAGTAEDWVAQGRYELSQGFEVRPLGAAPSVFGGVGGTLDREGLSFNNKFVLDAGGRLSWKIKSASISLDARVIRDRRFLSDELFVGPQFRLGLRLPF